MNSIQKINAINQKELATNTSYKASWHYDYRDTNYIYIGNIASDIEEKDIITIFSQYGVPTHINMIKDKETGRHRGFAFLKYANMKSCVLAVDNFNGVVVYERKLRVDHTYYKLKKDENEDDFLIDYSEVRKQQSEKKETKRIEGKKQESITAVSDTIDDEFKDPMADHIAQAANEDEEFKDPMADYVKKDSHKRHREHRSREHRHRHHSRHGHDHRSDRKSEHTSRDRSPTRE
ncbi:predicted protein [Scheffersomyces stipitis CBS 6054]|uniref:RRM domain-containing protein n=1 Tax=Scheffersomyces stipitis (strain ATCC 58785 / CBS 6054 / NBRC 10063 / NRRL Y-11545) TaxID=322104 RepID=A3LXE9_PICST|nr:predicted protein [Scheffersomyces stipitis CBS 6054]ABN67796.2 predicted protein [Scheffersomyces stipitis CBS 6054]KAG2732402.1 hypothetical protein G9P44_004819 [Scheffersomyces stipitis]